MDKQGFLELMQRANVQVKDVLHERGKEYGNFVDIARFCIDFNLINSHQVIEHITQITDDEYKKAITSIFMIGIKLARIENDTTNVHFDSVVDFLGYLEFLKEVNIKGFQLKTNINGSKLHKMLIEYANDVLKG